MKRKQKIPTWILSDEYGIDRDRHNWILYTRDGKSETSWKARSCHPTPQMSLVHLYQEVARNIPPHYDFVHHLEVAADRAHSLASEFLERINTNAQLRALTASESGDDSWGK